MRPHLLPLFGGWRAALLLAAGALLSPQRASAECGSHVTVLNPTAESGHDTMPSADDSGAPVKPPCQGPNCSRAPDRSPAPFAPVPTSGPLAKEAAQALSSVDPVASASSRPAEFISSGPIHRAPSIFHPPRTA